jgi:hypothetical protein
MIPTFNHPWIHADDIFDLTLSFFIFLYVVEGKLLLAFLIACLTALNRETGAFAAILYICISYRVEKPPLLALRACAMGFVPYLLALLVRKMVARS